MRRGGPWPGGGPGNCLFLADGVPIAEPRCSTPSLWVLSLGPFGPPLPLFGFPVYSLMCACVEREGCVREWGGGVMGWD